MIAVMPVYDRSVKSPGRKRPLPRRVAAEPDAAALARCAENVAYEGSPEHKSYPSFAGAPKLRSDATKCPKHLKDRDQLTGWLQQAIRQGWVSENPRPARFPRYVWVRQEGIWFEARLVNAGQGTYKGYPLAEDEIPKGLNNDRSPQ